MSDNATLPRELQNNVKFLDSLNETLSPDDAERDAVIDETLIGLNGSMIIGDIEIPPPTMGCVMLLEAIDSPFIAGHTNGVTLDDIFRALFILAAREEAVGSIMQERMSDIKARRAFDATEKTPEHLSIYMAYLERNKTHVDAFDNAVKEFSFAIGAFNPEDAVAKIGQYISASLAGFATIPHGEEPDQTQGDKKKASTLNGLPVISQQ